MMHTIMGVGLIGLVGKISKWDESAMFFDGSSMGKKGCHIRHLCLTELFVAAFVFGIIIYLTVTVPGLRTVVLPPTNPEEEADKLEALRVMCAGNVLVGLCLIGVLCMQVGDRFYRFLPGC